MRHSCKSQDISYRGAHQEPFHTQAATIGRIIPPVTKRQTHSSCHNRALTKQSDKQPRGCQTHQRSQQHKSQGLPHPHLSHAQLLSRAGHSCKAFKGSLGQHVDNQRAHRSFAYTLEFPIQLRDQGPPLCRRPFCIYRHRRGMHYISIPLLLLLARALVRQVPCLPAFVAGGLTLPLVSLLGRACLPLALGSPARL